MVLEGDGIGAGGIVRPGDPWEPVIRLPKTACSYEPVIRLPKKLQVRFLPSQSPGKYIAGQ